MGSLWLEFNTNGRVWKDSGGGRLEVGEGVGLLYFDDKSMDPGIR